MKVKFTRYERAAGLFVLIASVAGFFSTVGIGLKQGWFERKVTYLVRLNSADGVRAGSVVQMAGLRVGSVKVVDLKGAREVLVTLELGEVYAGKIRADSVVRVSRPFVIGERAFDILPGTESAEEVAVGSQLQVEMAPDLLELASGKSLAPYFDTIGKLAESLKYLAEAFSDEDRMKSFVGMFDELHPLLRQANSLSKDAKVLTRELNGLFKDLNGDRKLAVAVQNVSLLAKELNASLPHLLKDSPQLGSDMAKIAKNLGVLTDEMQKTLPAFSKIAPQLPRASERAIEALDETVVTLKALQKSFLLRSNVRDVKEEEAAREQKSAEPPRLPANQK